MFIKGKVYVRRDIHDQFGGQEQGGISTPADHDLVIIFTGEQGEEYGYQDGWTNDGVFMYTGEGQIGDMDFIRGNRAIRYHIDAGEDLHLFEYVDQGLVRYLSQMFCIGYQRSTAPDREGDNRSVIIFELVPIDAFEESDIYEELAQDTLPELRMRAIEQTQEEQPPRQNLQQAYYRSAAIKAYALARAVGSCEARGNEAPFITSRGRPYLEVHHIRRISDGGPDHPEWVAAICPNCHKRVHFSIDGEEYNSHIREIIHRKERNIIPKVMKNKRIK